jgi:hypothetical protein
VFSAVGSCFYRTWLGLWEVLQYAQGRYNILPTSIGGTSRAEDFLSTGLSLMGLFLLSEPNYDKAAEIPPHILEVDCKGDLKGSGKEGLGCYDLRGTEIKMSRTTLGSSHIPFFLVRN